jgi:hypothetical protein
MRENIRRFLPGASVIGATDKEKAQDVGPVKGSNDRHYIRNFGKQNGNFFTLRLFSAQICYAEGGH